MENDPIDGIDLTGQVAIVTGGGRGIGRAIATGLAAARASVGVVARSEDEIAETVNDIAQAGGRAVGVPTDVSAPESVERMIRDVERALGPVDLLVNNESPRATPPQFHATRRGCSPLLRCGLRGLTSFG